MSSEFKVTLLLAIFGLAVGVALTAMPFYLSDIFAPDPTPSWVWNCLFYLGIALSAICFFISTFMLLQSSKAEAILARFHEGGRGGSARVVGQNSSAEGGDGGAGGLAPGGSGGDAEVIGDNSRARGGDGGNAPQADGRGGRRTLSHGERLGMPTNLWGYGSGGAGANHPEYNRRLAILTQIRQEYAVKFPDDIPFINAGIDQVPIHWINARLMEMNEIWQVEGFSETGGYLMPRLC